ncbi:MAG: glycosyltransferase family 4 protein [Muribaculaceae bacterium]|nr:glycosyltransferase family 4 protein [Muribaculaceae bacterium]
MLNEQKLLDKVLFIGPNLKRIGGMMSVLNIYKDNFAKFHYMRSNYITGSNIFGRIANLFVLVWLLIKLPFHRVFKHSSILHVHHAAAKSFPRKSIIIRWGKILGYKVIAHCHAGHFKEYCDQKGYAKIKRTLDRCDHIIVLSQMWKDFFVNELGYTNVSIVNNPVEPVEKPSRSIMMRGKLNLLFFGMIIDAKGIFDAIDVISAHKADLAGHVSLHIGGDGEIDRMTDIIVSEDIEEEVRYVGCATGRKKDQLLRDCDVYILPSYFEGMPISILEAMAHGKAIISTTVGGIPEIVANGVNGFLLEPGDKEGLFNAIKMLLDEPRLITKFGNQSLERVIPFYPKSVKKQLLPIYSKLLK